MNSARVGNRESERGAAAVEFALVLPLLLMLVLGAIDWGWYFYLREVVTNAAREGARAGAVVTSDDPVAIARAAASTYLSNLGLTSSSPSATLPTVTVNGVAVPSINVAVTYPAGSLTGFSLPGFQSLVPAQIVAQAQMRREGM